MWGYTPKQAAGFLWYAARRQRRELAERLALQALAASGNGKEIKKQLKEWSKE